MLIVNADDWGRDPVTTNSIHECVKCGAVSSVSAMVFMEDSYRGAAIAREEGIDAGVHLNFTTPFSSRTCPRRLAERQQLLARYLLRHRLAQVVFHPGLMRTFEYVVAVQLDEYRRLFGTDPKKVDGHHHMHLCENVLLQGLLPRGALVRGSFSFESGEKSRWNRLYRRFVNARLSRHYRFPEYFFSLWPIEPYERLQRIFSLASHSVVEVETHPVRPEEYRFLTGGDIFQYIEPCLIAPASALAERL